MANDEDLARLRQGVAVWNAWRSQSPERYVDLSDVDLAGANLREADVTEADLREFLFGANLREAMVSFAARWLRIKN